jgi:hypothetical protein
MVQGFLPNGGGGGRGGGPFRPPVGKSTLKGSPGLITSTGGLFGTNFNLLMPLFDTVFNKTYLALVDPDNNDTEEEAFYIFKQEDVMPSRVVSVHKLIVVYRELGPAKFSVGVQVYIRKANKFYQKSVALQIVDRKDITAPFPDRKLRELPVDLVIEGERPQVFIRRKANSGPLCITRIHMVGHADEKEVV